MKTITEYLIDTLRGTRVYEMALSQQDCEKRVCSQTGNILENLVLILYFRISGFYTINIDHWKEELATAILNAAKFEPKKDNSESRRARIVDRVFKKEDIRNFNQIYYGVRKKFRKEKETRWPEDESSQQYLDQAILGASAFMDDISDLIVKNDDVLIDGWVAKL